MPNLNKTRRFNYHFMAARDSSLPVIAALIAVLLVLTGCGGPPDLATVVKDVRSGIVRIETTEGGGSGVIFETTPEDSALLLTNYHVVENSSNIKVIVDDTVSYRGHLQGYDVYSDLAVLSICCGDFKSLSFGKSANLKPGSEVIAIGYPRNIPGAPTVTRGIVSAIRSEGYSEIIQMDAPINPGNSGGPLLTANGKVLGINTFSIRDSEGLGFAVSESTVQKILPNIRGKRVLAIQATPTPSPIPTVMPTPTPSPTIIPAATATPKPRPAVAPTRKPTPTVKPTATTTPTQIPTATPRPTAVPQPRATSTPEPTATPLPTSTQLPTATPTVVLADYFTRGSSQDQVQRVQGTPDEINNYSFSGYEVWQYGWSTVTFDLASGQVKEWDNDGQLRVELFPTTSASATPGYFTRGSSWNDVLHAQGTPDGINNYSVSGHEVWQYGWSTVTFDLASGQVREWDNDGQLRVELFPTTSSSATPGYFTRGSSWNDVLHAQGTPDEINNYSFSGYEVWQYGWSTVTFDLASGQVKEWDNDGNLQAR